MNPPIYITKAAAERMYHESKDFSFVDFPGLHMKYGKFTACFTCNQRLKDCHGCTKPGVLANIGEWVYDPKLSPVEETPVEAAELAVEPLETPSTAPTVLPDMPEWTEPKHEEINLATTTAEELGLDPFEDASLMAAIDEAKRKASVPSLSELGKQALRLAEKGWFVFPLNERAKQPDSELAPNGYKSASNDSAVILEWWTKKPNDNIGVDLGRSNLTSLDFDKPDKIPAWLNETKTYKVKSAKGIHIYFSGARKTTKLRIDGEVIGDLKSIGGYVLSEGCIHPDGPTYTVIDDSPVIAAPDISSLIENNREPVNASVDGPPIPYKSHDTELASIAGVLRKACMSAAKIEEHLIDVCEKRCVDYGHDYKDMCHKIANSIGKYAVGKAPIPVLMDGKVAGTSATPKPNEPVAPKPTVNLNDFFYRRGEDIKQRIWVHEGFNALSTKTIWIGPEKAEKSLFALRKAMHEACGADWIGYKSAGAIKVCYFDAENPVQDIDDRYNELIQDFTAGQQILIDENLRVYKGRDFLEKTRGDFSIANVDFWREFGRQENERGAVNFYFDCLYQFHSKQSKDNEGLKSVIDEMHSHVGLHNGFIMLHHTHKDSDENLGKQKKTALRFIGARQWSNKIYGGGHTKKMADIVVCQERYEVRDGSVVEESFIDFAFYSRLAPDSVLMSFEDDLEKKYKRHLVTSLSKNAAAVKYALEEARGPWKSKHEAVKAVESVCSRRKAYERFKELISKGYLLEGPKGSLTLRSGPGDSLTDDAATVAETEEHMKSAKKWLRQFLGSGSMPVDSIRPVAEREGFNWETIRKNRGKWGVASHEDKGSYFWRNE